MASLYTCGRQRGGTRGAPDLRPYETRLRDICMISSPEVRTLPGHGSTTSAAGGVAGAADKRTVTVTRRPRQLAT